MNRRQTGPTPNQRPLPLPRRRRHRAALPRRRAPETGSDGLFLVLAIGAVLLASLLAPRSPREPLSPEAPDHVLQPVVEVTQPS